jgi:hypothetical protein
MEGVEKLYASPLVKAIAIHRLPQTMLRTKVGPPACYLLRNKTANLVSQKHFV